MAVRTGHIGMIGRTGGSGKYTVDDFKKFHPEFFAEPDPGCMAEQHPQGATRPDNPPPFPVPPVPAVLDMYILLAHASIPKNLYKEAWQLCMGLYTAHLLTRANQLAAAAVGAPLDDGRIASSESVDGVSVSYDTSAERALAEDFGELATTAYGKQLIYWIKMMSIGGLYV